MEPRHERIAKIALAAGARYGLALAGGYAVSAHGIGSRPSGDVDLFTSWQHGGEFPELTSAIVAALEAAGYKASVVMSAETFARLTVTDPEDGSEEKVELSADWRAHDPVQLAIGPVLHADDAVANKVCALFGRALPRDFLDVHAAITSGRYTRAVAGTRGPIRPWLRPSGFRRCAGGADSDHRRRVRRIRDRPGRDRRHAPLLRAVAAATPRWRTLIAACLQTRMARSLWMNSPGHASAGRRVVTGWWSTR